VSVEIRRYATSERDQLIQVIDAVCYECPWMSTTRFEPTPAWMHALQAPDSPDHFLLVVEAAGNIVGWGRIFPMGNEGQRQVGTLGIGLLPAYRDQGIGTALVRQILKQAKKVGYHRIYLSTHQDNGRARHVFSRCGFIVARRFDAKLLEMVCELSGETNRQGEHNCESYFETRACRSLQLIE
jgi:ribosomal protein S18 acetylase RimI-like enzyme